MKHPNFHQLRRFKSPAPDPSTFQQSAPIVAVGQTVWNIDPVAGMRTSWKVAGIKDGMVQVVGAEGKRRQFPASALNQPTKKGGCRWCTKRQ